MAVGAAGGIYAYRKGRELVAEARERGVLQAVQTVTADASGAAAQAKALLSIAAPVVAAVSQSSQPAVPGAAAAKVLRETR